MQTGNNSHVSFFIFSITKSPKEQEYSTAVNIKVDYFHGFI